MLNKSAINKNHYFSLEHIRMGYAELRYFCMTIANDCFYFNELIALFYIF